MTQNQHQAVQKIKRLQDFNIDALNTIAKRYDISLTLAVLYFHATH